MVDLVEMDKFVALLEKFETRLKSQVFSMDKTLAKLGLKAQKKLGKNIGVKNKIVGKKNFWVLKSFVSRKI